MEAIKEMIIAYLPTILSAIMSVIVGIIGKKLTTINKDNILVINRAVADNIERLDRNAGLLQVATEEKLTAMENSIATMALENAELKKKLNKAIELLGKVEVKDDITVNKEIS